MGISPQIVRIPTQIKNDKDLTQTQKVQDFNSNKKSQFPDYVKPLLKQYICLLRFNQDFGNLIKDLDYDNVKEGSLKKRETHIVRLCFYIKRYGEAVKSGFFKDLSEEELNFDVFRNIVYVESAVDECSATYIDIFTEEDKDGDYVSVFKLDKQKYEDNVDNDFPGLRKVADLLKLYHETIKYERLYQRYEIMGNISYTTDESEDESENEKRRSIEEMLRSDSDSDSDYDSDPNREFYRYPDSDDGSDYDSDSESDE